MTMRPGHMVEERVRSTCPFCGGEFAIVEPAGVLHVEPACQTFLDLEPLEYLVAARRERERRN